MNQGNPKDFELLDKEHQLNLVEKWNSDIKSYYELVNGNFPNVISYIEAKACL